MSILIKFPYFSPLCFMILTLTSIQAADFHIQNNCSYTIWAAANPGGGRELHPGQSWVINTDPNFQERGSIWARTNCNFNENGTGKCDSGDCNGVLHCVSDGVAPLTLAEYKFHGLSYLDYFDISLVGGFNVPMEFKGTSSECNKVIRCTGDINGLCPTELRHPGGCNNPCTVFKNDQFCCFTAIPKNCRPTAYSKFFKDLCPDANSYAFDDATSYFSCLAATDYKKMPKGTLEVLLVCAEGLEDTDFLTNMDPYVIVTCRTQEKKTSVASGQGTTPNWNENFIFTITEGTTELKLKIMDGDGLSQDDFVGEATIPLHVPQQAYNVVKDDKFQGEIRVGLIFKPEGCHGHHHQGYAEGGASGQAGGGRGFGGESYGGWKEYSY